jgi:hypothetical protein
MRFGLSDLGELPSLKEFEALAREALGTDEGVAAVPDELPTDVVDEVLDAPENTGAFSESASAADEHARQDAFAEAFTHKLQGGPMSEENLSSRPDDEEVDEETAAEVTATNEGMPSGELDEAPQDPKAVQHSESTDTGHGKAPKMPAGKSGNKNNEESKGAAAGE